MRFAACCGEDQSWRQIGQRLGVAGDTARERVVEAIQALALWLDGDPVPPSTSDKVPKPTAELVITIRRLDALSVAGRLSCLP